MRELLIIFLAVATLIIGTEVMHKRYIFDNCLNKQKCIIASIIYIVIVIIIFIFLNSVLYYK